jgi:hypothetical protein
MNAFFNSFYMQISVAKSMQIFIVFWGLLFLGGCSKEEKVTVLETPYHIEDNLILGQQLFKQRLGGRDELTSFEILTVSFHQQRLQVAVQGSDVAGSFQFLWDGRIQESYPMGVQLLMDYTGKSENFDRHQEKIITVNLSKILNDRSNLNQYHFKLINGSKAQSVILNPDSTLTIRLD